MISRRRLVQGSCALATLAVVRGAAAANAPASIVVTKDPNCGCCNGWVEHLQQAGFSVKVRDVPDINRAKARLGVPADLAACHTAEVEGYVIEGHVPASALRRFLIERPNAKGLAVRGMPVGSPGMEIPNTPPDEYDVIEFGRERRVYARFHGAVELPISAPR
jgi:hypothetical protein